MANLKDINNKADFGPYKDKVLKGLSDYIDSLQEDNYKKSYNLAKWLKYYTAQLRREEKFHPKFMPVYKRGSVIFVDLGYNLGSEYGGVHYVVVLDKKDSKYSPVLTVLPMTSLREGETREDVHNKFDLFIGDEFYNTLHVKTVGLFNAFQEELDILRKNNNDPGFDGRKHVQSLIGHQKNLQACMERAGFLKKGGCVLLNQITTISKMRIIEPTKPSDALFDIVLSNATMEKIAEKMKSLYF